MLVLLLPFSKAAVEISFGFLLVGWLLDRLNPATRTQSLWYSTSLRMLAIAVALFLAVSAASIAVSNFPLQSLRGLIGKWLEYLLFFIIVTDLASRSGILRRAMAIFAISSFCVAAQGIMQELLMVQKAHWSHPLFHYQRMIGPYENPIDLATYLMVAFPCLAMYAMISRPRWRLLLWSLVGLLGWCLLRTGALGAWIGLFLSLAVAIRHPLIRRYGSIVVLIFVIGGGMVVSSRTGRLRQLILFEDIGMIDRLVMWKAAFKMIQDRPVLGHGVNTFMANYLAYRVGGEQQPRYAHNCYLQVAAETGILGLLSFLGVLGFLFTKLTQGLKRAESSPEGPLLLGLFIGLVAFVLQAAIDTNFYSLRQAALFWVFAGLALGLSERIQRTASATS